MKARILIIVLFSIFSFGCTSDDGPSNEKLQFEGVKGTVLNTVACHSENNGLAYEIEINNLSSIERIITPNLPDRFKESGIEIIFDMENSQEGFGICVSIYQPSDFYKLSNIEINPSNDQ